MICGEARKEVISLLGGALAGVKNSQPVVIANPQEDMAQLLCTEKAQPVIARGREVQERFFARLLQNTDAATREAFFRTMEIIGKNLDDL